MSEIVKYEHHGTLVSVMADLKGKHREHCLCYSCDRMRPGTPEHCPIASRLYQICVDHSLVTPVYECPSFELRR